MRVSKKKKSQKAQGIFWLSNHLAWNLQKGSEFTYSAQCPDNSLKQPECLKTLDTETCFEIASPAPERA